MKALEILAAIVTVLFIAGFLSFAQDMDDLD